MLFKDSLTPDDHCNDIIEDRPDSVLQCYVAITGGTSASAFPADDLALLIYSVAMVRCSVLVNWTNGTSR